MIRTLILGLLFLMACAGFKSAQKGNEPIIYLLPKVVEQEAVEQIKKIVALKGDSVRFYTGLSRYHSNDTFLLTIHSYYPEIKKPSQIDRLIKASNRFTKVGKQNLPLVFSEDILFSSIINTKNAEGGIGRMTLFETYYSIVFVGKSYEKGKVTWAGYAH
jgi:hypothetical protein